MWSAEASPTWHPTANRIAFVGTANGSSDIFQVIPGTTLKRGREFMGVDLAAWLEQEGIPAVIVGVLLGVWWIAIGYAVFASAWIIFSDQVLELVADPDRHPPALQT